MKTRFNATLELTAVLVVIMAASPAAAQIPLGGIETFTTDIWDFFIANIGLMVVGLAVIGALLSAMVGDPGRGIGKAIFGAAIGAFIGAVPLLAEYVLGLGGGGGVGP